MSDDEVLDQLKKIVHGRSSLNVLKNTALDPMRHLYVANGGTFKGWLRDDNQGGASTDWGTVPNNYVFPYDVAKIDNASTASGFVAVK